MGIHPNLLFEWTELGYNLFSTYSGYLPCPLYVFGRGVCLL